MGLDMYFHKETYIGNEYRVVGAFNEKDGLVTVEGKGTESIKNERINTIVETIGYLRKANAIHNWIIQNCAEGVDDCRDIDLDSDKIKLLYETVMEVLDSSKLVDGDITNGYTIDKNGEEIPNIEEGRIIEDYSIADDLLPTVRGFFFGGTNYDEYYIEDLMVMKSILESIFKEDPEFYHCYSYRASW